MPEAARPRWAGGDGSHAPPIITLLTDFGVQDYYVGAIKGVLLRHVPHARIVDLTHSIPPQDVRAGAFVLERAAREFPAHTVHLAIVDPGVGTARRALAARLPRSIFVAPDNGLLGWVLLAPACQVRAITHPALRAARVSSTFQGRDLFAPAAAQLAAGFPFDDVGPVVVDPVTRLTPRPLVEPGRIQGQIIHVDRFGNLVTNIDRTHLPSGPIRVHLPDGTVLESLRHTYSDVPAGRPLALVGSTDLLEVAVRDGSAAEVLQLERGALIRVESL